MTISGISFKGREGCIEPAVNTAKKAGEFFNGKAPIVVDNTEKTVSSAIRKTDLASYLDSRQNVMDSTMEQAKIEADKLAEAYRAANGII